MLIMVIQSTDCKERETIATQLSHLTQPQVATIEVGFVAEPHERVKRLSMLLSRAHSVLNVVMGANSAEEIAYLRQQNALFCNVHRHYPSALLNVPGAVSHHDVLIASVASDDHGVEVLSPDEAFSECFLRAKQRRRKAA